MVSPDMLMPTVIRTAARIRSQARQTVIRENVKLAESPAVGLDVFRHAPGSRGAQDYEFLYGELLGAGFLQ